MASVKLTNALRSVIWNNIRHKQLDPKRVELEKSLELIGDEIYNAVVGDKVLKLMESIPDMYFIRGSYIYVQNVASKFINIQMSTSRVIPPKCHYGKPIYHTEMADPKKVEEAFVRYMKQREMITAHDRDVNFYKDETMRILHSVNTVKQLLQVWPEVKEFLPDSAKNVDNAQLPMVQVTKLNEQLGIKGA